MADIIDGVTGHGFIATVLLGSAITMWWLGFPGPPEVPFGMWTLGIGVLGRITNKTNDRT